MLPLIELCEHKIKDFRYTNMFENIDEEFLNLLYDSQKEIKETDQKKMRQWLLVIDDSISDE